MMLTAGIIAVLIGLLGVGYAVRNRKLPERFQLDQSDPIVLAAVREVDAEFPMLPPLLDPKIRRQDEERLDLLAAEESHRKVLVARNEAAKREHERQMQLAREMVAMAITAAEQTFFTRRHSIPPREDVAHTIGDMFVMKDGRKVLQSNVALYGWEGALERASKES